MELCHENVWLWNWKISEKQKTDLFQRNETHIYGLMQLSDSLKKTGSQNDVIHKELSRGNKLPVIASLRLRTDLCDCHEANIVTRLKGTCGEKLFGRPRNRESGERLGLFRHNSIIYYTHFEITGGSCNLIGSNWCDLFPNRTTLL